METAEVRAAAAYAPGPMATRARATARAHGTDESAAEDAATRRARELEAESGVGIAVDLLNMDVQSSRTIRSPVARATLSFSDMTSDSQQETLYARLAESLTLQAAPQARIARLRCNLG